jgi:small-conductance mechanosensitive channel
MDSDQILTALKESLDSFIRGILEHIPGFLGFLAILILGWITARILQTLSARLVGRIDRLDDIKQAGLDRSGPLVVGRIVFWIVLIFFVAVATEFLGLSILSDLLGGLARYLPNILAAAVIGFTGVLAANLARRGISRASASAGLAYSDLLGRAVQVPLLLITALISIDQLGIDIQFLTTLITLLIGVTAGGLSLAFGIGAGNTVRNVLASYYLARIYQVGHTVKIDNVQGHILEFTPTGVILDTLEGRVYIPAHQFNEKISILVTGGE